MVFKIAGWVSFEQVRIWLDKQGRRHQHLENDDLISKLNC
jgi:hypothetical protein